MRTALLSIALLAPCSILAQRANPQLAADIAKIKAVDNHAHPPLNDPADKDFDALPVDNLEPSSDQVRLRPDSPDTARAWRALYNASTLEAMQKSKTAIRTREGSKYPAWVLDHLNIEVMLANRVTMGPGVAPPRFRWVSYVDALMFPLDNSRLAAENTDRKAFFELEDRLLKRYYADAGITQRPQTLDEYLSKLVTATLERQKRGGAVAVKYEAAYLRGLNFGNPPKEAAERVYDAAGVPSNADYKTLQDYIFHYIASECGRLGLAVHLHTMAGAGSYFHVAGANPLALEPTLNDPSLRKTNFVMIHGGWPFNAEITALLTKPNAYLDFSGQSLLVSPRTLSRSIREWLEQVPEKVMFATDAYPFSPGLDWEESGWIASQVGRQALTLALSGMLEDGEITYQRALELARMVLAGNAKKLYGF